MSNEFHIESVEIAVPEVSCWPSTSVRRAAAIFPESEVDRTRRGYRENGAHDPERPFAFTARGHQLHTFSAR